MPLNRPALTLGPGPRGVQDARRWVVGICAEIDRNDLIECTELAVSEVVTNAILHATAPVQVRMRGTHEHPRVEVHDSSPELPQLTRDVLATSFLDSDDERLNTFGRGLAIVARASEAWGVDVEADGKVVWFVPRTEFCEDAGPEAIVTGQEHSTSGEPDPDSVVVTTLGVPVVQFETFSAYFHELRREVRLLALAARDVYPLAEQLAELFATVAAELNSATAATELATARSLGQTQVDLHFHASPNSASEIARFIDLLDVTDRFCRQERMLALARETADRVFQQWFLGEFVRQLDGAEPRRWYGPPSSASDATRIVSSPLF